ncbi:ATP-binding protein [Streptomyces boncukensis]|uniref:ATP-binding protein n=1 Tax=Streptomyces boncukensis TaxID=2711219 RepID=A0A6G4X1B5_9ACTN|nr:ATP-binding protein [Streptomyces boncukensis]NGO71285.1 ATP-binding protein [Streptomyces boncukensis]
MESRGVQERAERVEAVAERPVRAERAERLPHEGPWRFAAPAQDASVPQLRHAVRDLLARQSAPVPEEVRESLLLILSELVTNSVRHAALLTPQIGVEVSLGGGWLRVSVEDSHPYRPKALAAVPDDETTGGRGLLLVKALTGEAGGVCDVEQTGAGGKVIWAALPLTSQPSPPSPHGSRDARRPAPS